jgi:hypothetical protein
LHKETAALAQQEPESLCCLVEKQPRQMALLWVKYVLPITRIQILHQFKPKEMAALGVDHRNQLA